MSQFPAAVLLDMDGTLFDSERAYKTLWQNGVRRFGLELTDEMYKPLIGAGFEQCLGYIRELLGDKVSMAEFYKVLAEAEQTLKESGAIPLKPGALELLNWLQEHEVPTALVTSARRESVVQHFARLGGTDRFRVVVNGNDVTSHKPEPEPYLMAARQLNLQPEQTLAVEDSNTGATAAIRAGCRTVLIPDVLPPTAEVEAGCLMVLDHLTELQSWLEGQFQA